MFSRQNCAAARDAHARGDRECWGTWSWTKEGCAAQIGRFDAETIDLGNEPPLSVDGGIGGLVDRRRVSVQWFSGTILTGLCGAALMGGAVFASLDGETNFAAAPERVETALRGALVGIGDHVAGHAQDRPACRRHASRASRARSCACPPSRACAIASSCACGLTCASPAICR